MGLSCVKNKKVCNWSFFILSVLIFSLLNVFMVCAQEKTEIYVNGLKLETDAEPVIKDGRTYVPLRNIGEILGYTVSYDETAKTIAMDQPELGIEIKMTIGSDKAYINGEETVMQAAPFISEGRTMVPVRFVSEAMDSRVDWQSSYTNDDIGIVPNKVTINCSYPVKLPSGNARIASEVHSQSWSLVDDDGKEYTIGYDMILPVFSEMKDPVFQKWLNDGYKDFYEEVKQNTIDIYEEQNQEQYDYRYNYSYDYFFSIVSDNANILSITENYYIYSGGAHGMPVRECANIDFSNSKVLVISDLFKSDKNYEQKLLSEINSLRLAKEKEYGGISEITELPHYGGYSFYFEDGNLVIFYHPYALASYARGFIEFRIPLENLADYLKDEYKAL